MAEIVNKKRKAAETTEPDERPDKKAKMLATSTEPSHDASEPPNNNAEESVPGAAEDAGGEQGAEVDEQPPPVKESAKKRGKRKATAADLAKDSAAQQPRAMYRKLAPPRPFPTVPTSVSATGPRSAHVEGKNYICVTRKTPLGAYLRRCKNIVLNDGHKTLHLSALGAAIPHLLMLATSLPDILPYAPEEIHTEVLTGTVEVQDEVIPDDEDEDISLRTREKSSLSVTITIGDGVDEGARTGKGRKKSKTGNSGHNSRSRAKGKQRGGDTTRGEQSGRDADEEQEDREPIIVREEDMDQD